MADQKNSFARTISDMPPTHPVSLGLLGPAIYEEIGYEQQDSQHTYLQRLAALAFGLCVGLWVKKNRSIIHEPHSEFDKYDQRLD